MADIASHETPSTSGKPIEKKNDDKKQTVLEKHGYALGKTIGNGSYATVKVIIDLKN